MYGPLIMNPIITAVSAKGCSRQLAPHFWGALCVFPPSIYIRHDSYAQPCEILFDTLRPGRQPH